MKTTNTLKEIQYNIGIAHINDMNMALLKGKDYSNQLRLLVGLLVKEEFLTDLYFNEYWTICYNILWLMLGESEQREEYEQCGAILQIIENEEEIYKAWCLTLPDEDQQDALDELDYTKLAIKMERDAR